MHNRTEYVIRDRHGIEAFDDGPFKSEASALEALRWIDPTDEDAPFRIYVRTITEAPLKECDRAEATE